MIAINMVSGKRHIRNRKEFQNVFSAKTYGHLEHL